jgi:lipoate-protein ligase B
MATNMAASQLTPDVEDAAPRPLRVLDLGSIAYSEAWDLQNRIAQEVASGHVAETLLLLEHPHTYTCGRRGGRDHILATDEQLHDKGIVVLDVDRGGDVTYHGPGQLVAYPIINLRNYGSVIDYPGYVRTLERVLIAALDEMGVQAHMLQDFSGAWVHGADGEEKIAAIGVRVDGRGVTTHGIALNVTTDLRLFDYIVPCGITDKGVASMANILPDVPSMIEVKDTFARHFAVVFNFRLPESGDA